MTKWGKIVAVFTFAVFVSFGLNWLLNYDLTRGLEEEKYFTHNAMLAYRRDPKAFEHRITRDMMHKWSDMESIFNSAQKRSSAGSWAKTADQIPFTDPSTRFNFKNEPYCVVRTATLVAVIDVDDPS